MDEVEDFLAHYGVKGMRWGVRRERSTSVTREDVKEAGLAAAKIAAKYGGPSLAAAAGTLASPVALPSIAVLGLSAKILMDDDAREAISAAAKFSSDWAKDQAADFKSLAKYGSDVHEKSEHLQKVSGIPDRKEGGMMFNPDADISGGNVIDVGTPADQARAGWDPDPKPKWDWPW